MRILAAYETTRIPLPAWPLWWITAHSREKKGVRPYFLTLISWKKEGGAHDFCWKHLPTVGADRWLGQIDPRARLHQKDEKENP
jgi:hypothetical protein